MSTSPDIERCLASLEQHSKSFALAARVLPPDRRAEVAATYAWCRRVDDAIDLDPAGDAAAVLERLRAELRSIYAGEPQDDPVLRAFQRVVQDHGVPEQYPRELLAGMEMDVAATRYRTLSDLLLYCYRVAGTVGLMLCHVIGVRSADALRHAAHLGMAMQLTNICRDVREDWERGRVYVPAALLPGDGAWVPPRPGARLPERAAMALSLATERLLALADAYYRSGDRGMRALSFRTAIAVRAARAVYSAIGRQLRKHRWNVLAPRAVVPLMTKLWLVACAAVITLAEIPIRAVRRFRPAALPGVVRYPHDVLPV